MGLPRPVATEVQLNGSYKFMYDNFVIATQRDLYVFLQKSGEVLKGLKFGFLVYRYGYPNDEIGHPFMDCGLGYYGLYQIENSPWVQEIRGQNSAHPKDTVFLHVGMRHYIIRFKDVTLEVIAKDFHEIEISTGGLDSLISSELQCFTPE